MTVHLSRIFLRRYVAKCGSQSRSNFHASSDATLFCSRYRRICRTQAQHFRNIFRDAKIGMRHITISVFMLECFGTIHACYMRDKNRGEKSLVIFEWRVRFVHTAFAQQRCIKHNDSRNASIGANISISEGELFGRYAFFYFYRSRSQNVNN